MPKPDGIVGTSNAPRLTLKQRRFVEEYAADGIATQAYFRAFGRYTSKGTRRSYFAASDSARMLLQNPAILAEVEAAQAAYAAKMRISKMRVLREVAALALSDVEDLFEEDQVTGLPKSKRWGDIPAAMKKAIQSVKIKKRILKSIGDDTGGVQESIEEVEYKLHPKGSELDRLCKKLGFYSADPLGPAVEGGSVTTFRIPDNGRGKPPEPETPGDTDAGD